MMSLLDHPEAQALLNDATVSADTVRDCTNRLTGSLQMICRLRLDVGLDDPPGVQPAGKRGPKPKKGPRQVKLQEWARREDTPWEDREVEWSGGERKTMRLFSRTGLWYTAGQDPVAIRSVLARDPEGALEDAGSLCTEEEMLPAEIMRYMVWRWSVEVTFEELRAHYSGTP